MKRLYVILLAVATAAFMFSACQKPSSKPAGKDNEDDEKGQEQGGDQQGGDKGNTIEISIDGNFADWDAITESVANSNDYVDMLKGGSDDPIQVMKIASDPENIYFYFEFLAELLPQNEACGTWGSSFTEDALDVEMGDDDESFREVMHLFIDPDGNDKTGFLTFEDPEEGGPAIENLGSEMCAQFFMYFKPSIGEVCVAFEQTLIGPTKVGPVGENDQVDGDYTGDFDYNGTICQDEWPDSGDEAAFPLWGWQNFDDSGTGDNDCPRPSNWKSGKLDGSGIVKVEFALEKDDIVNLKDSDEELACGVIFDWDDRDAIYQATGVLRVSYAK